MNWRFLTTLAIASALTLAGCSSEGSGQPTTGDPGANGEPTVDAGSGTKTPDVTAPEVAKPISNIERYKQDPCKILTKSQATELGYANLIEREKDASDGPACRWRDSDTNEVAIVVLSDQPDGLTGVYRNRDSFDYFEPTEVAGYPGLFAGVVDDRADGGCAMDVGVTDQQVITLSASMLPGTAAAERPCEILKRAGKMAVKTMSAGK